MYTLPINTRFKTSKLAKGAWALVFTSSWAITQQHFWKAFKTPLVNSQPFLHLHKANGTYDIDGSCYVMPHSLTLDLLFQKPRREMMGYKDNSAYLQRPSCWGSKTGWRRGVCVPFAAWLEENAFLKPDVAETEAAGCLLEWSPHTLEWERERCQSVTKQQGIRVTCGLRWDETAGLWLMWLRCYSQPTN